MDWGLAKIMGDGPVSDPEKWAGVCVADPSDSGCPRTLARTVLGTPAFMPPEQAAGSAARSDARSDVFGLGAILAVVLTGQPPFVEASAEATRRKAARGDLGGCLERLGVCGADPELVALCKRCLSPAPDKRPADGGAVAAVVASLRQAAEERVRRAEQSASEARTRRTAQLALVVTVGVVLVGGAAVARWQDRRAVEAERRVTRALDTAALWANRAAAPDAETAAGADAAVGLWRQAVAAAEYAEGVANAGRLHLLARATENAGRMRSELRSAEAAATRARRDAELVSAIEAARELTSAGRLGGRQAVAVADAAYARALEAAGVDASTPEALASALRAERPAVRAVVIPALDPWVETSAEQAAKQRLRAVLDLADDDPFRRQVRAAVAARDRAALLRLADQPEVIQLPAVTVDQLARGLFALHDYPTAERVLRTARDHFPNDFWLAADLGTTLLLRQLAGHSTPAAPANRRPATWPPDPARVEEIVGCYRTAIALRPTSVVGYTGLAFSLHMLKGDPLGAESAYLKLVDLSPTFPSGHLGLASVLQQRGDLDGAATAYRSAIEVAPGQVRALAWVLIARPSHGTKSRPGWGDSRLLRGTAYTPQRPRRANCTGPNT